jgi:hypothetical protein
MRRNDNEGEAKGGKVARWKGKRLYAGRKRIEWRKRRKRRLKRTYRHLHFKSQASQSAWLLTCV